jgi:ParB family chromosome partitioning protein
MSKSLEELTEQLDLDVRHIPVNAIKPNPDNPNEMSDATFGTLRGDIRDNGYTQPILVRPVDEGFQIIDGEHRWRAVSELGFASIPAIVWESTDEDDAKLRLITMNRLRGEFVPLKMAYVIADLAERIPEDQLRSRLGMTGNEFQDHLRNANLSDSVGESIAAVNERPEGKSVSVFCTFDQAAIIEAVLDAVAPSKEDRGEALSNICHEWAAQQNQ